MAKSLLLVFLSIAIGMTGQLCLKLGMGQVGRVGAENITQPLELLIRLLTQPLVLVALPLYAVGFLVWAVVLSRLSLSFAYPLLAATYVLTPLAAWLILNEEISAARWVGIGVVFIGVVIIGKS
ncbi:MAG: EamA family transporter [Candidatus Marsarchaeota archaeon]|nr:EamA family transporter [Candidatus Marsarchaeota archaeon]